MEITVQRLVGTSQWNATLREPGTRWPMVFHFQLMTEDPASTEDVDKRRYVNTGFEIRALSEDEEAGLSLGEIAIDPLTVQRIASRYAGYVSLARQWVMMQGDGIEEAGKALRGTGRGPGKRLSADFYRIVLMDYEARLAAGGHPVKEIAESYSVDISTASKWIKTAKKRQAGS